MKTTNKIIIIDLESTCWKGSTREYQQKHSEIIEIGVCILNRETGEVTQNEGILLKPVHSEVSDFCTKLTSLSSEMLESDGITLEQACCILRDKYNSAEYTWASYGGYDRTMLTEQCRRFNVAYPMSEDHINVKVLFSETKGLKKGIGMSGALKMIKVPLDGTHHRGVDDARNIAGILKWIFLRSQ